MRRTRGQGAVENVVVISVLTVAVVIGSYAFVPSFGGGVQALASDVKYVLENGAVGVGMGADSSGRETNEADWNDNDAGDGFGRPNRDPDNDSGESRKRRPENDSSELDDMMRDANDSFELINPADGPPANSQLGDPLP